jgi:uncharacterized protein YndB with AHSA1/START domain
VNQQLATPSHVRKTIRVATRPERAFRVFTEHMGTWWPLVSHHIGKAAAQTCVVEPFAGGRWYERGVDGSECEWGRVLAYEPPRRLVLAWQISADWQPDANLNTEVEVLFIADGDGTRVELEHRLLTNFGARAAEMAAVFDSPGGWNGLLEAFKTAADHAE